MAHRILVADDEELERRALRRILSGDGLPELEILEAENGREALELAGEQGFDAAFLDIRMPGIDGIEAARLLRERFPELPIVFLTAHDSFEYARTALRLRVEDFLLKPASGEEVRASLLRALESSPSSRSSPRPLEALFESAVTYLADELRADLGADCVPGEKLARYLSLEGRAGGLVAVAAIRLAAGDRSGGLIAREAVPSEPGRGGGGNGRGEAGSRLRAELLALGALFEQSFASPGLLAIAGAGQERLLCVLAGDGKDWGTEASMFTLFESFAGRARSDLGLQILAGIAMRSGRAGPGPMAEPGEANPGGAAAELGTAARRVASLASAARPIIVCPLRDSGASQRGPEGEGPGSGRRTALRALELIEARHAEELSLEGLASEIGVSPSHLSRLLGRVAGLGFADCLSRFRVERAKYFLASSSVSVKEVAGLVGFRDPAYFARVFRRFEAMSPAEYRSRSAKR